MAGVSFVASSRGAFSAAGKTVTLATPARSRKGDVLVALLARNGADLPAASPPGWARVDSLGSGADVLEVHARMIGDNEPSAVAFSFATVANECQGELVALRGTAPGVFREAVASIASTATTALTTAAPISQQAVNLILTVWTCAGAPSLALPGGFTAVDNFNTAIVTPRSMLVGYRIAGATGPAIFVNATASAITTGRSFSIAIRDRVPVQPAALVDLVPGNIGLIGKDTRRAR